MNDTINKSIDLHIESLIIAAKKNLINIDQLLEKIINIDIYTVCNEKILNFKNIILPLCVELNSKKYVCAFTNLVWAREYMTTAANIVKLKGKEFLTTVPEDYGVIFNPNFDSSMTIEAFGIKNILKKFNV
jgi:hypothetical protein